MSQANESHITRRSLAAAIPALAGAAIATSAAAASCSAEAGQFLEWERQAAQWREIANRKNNNDDEVDDAIDRAEIYRNLILETPSTDHVAARVKASEIAERLRFYDDQVCTALGHVVATLNGLINTSSAPDMAGFAVAAVARPESRLAALYLEADAIAARKATLNANADDVPEADWDEFFNREKALVLEVLALPATRAHAAIKARVVGMIHDDDWQGLKEDAGAQWDKALSVQVLRAMAGAV